MLTDNMISTKAFCANHRLEHSFLSVLCEYGLLEIASIDEAEYIPEYQLPRLEQMIRLHFELDINPEGIDAIIHLLDRVKNMQSEISSLKNRLQLYEDE